MPEDFEAMWAAIAPVGRSAATGGYARLPWATAETELRAWFAEQAAARGLEVRTDALGSQVAWWLPDGGEPVAGVLAGSHLDSVVEGGGYDGPLGVVSAFAAVDLLRARGVVPRRPVGVGAYVAEEGSRFGLACLGSRWAAGEVTWEQVRGLRDRDGVGLADALDAAGLGPSGDDAAGRRAALRASVATFVELHVEQGRGLVDRGAPVGVASGIWPHGRYRFDFTGRADHAGSTRMEDRADPMLTYATTALGAAEAARRSGTRATFGRLDVAPNGTNAIASRVTAWLDARAETDAQLGDLVAEVTHRGTERAAADGTALEVTAESVSGAVAFDAALAAALAADPGDPGGADRPVLASQAGHDAGILAGAGIPTAMLFVRNPTGVSHAPEEHAAVADCLAGVDALADTLERLVR